MTRLSTFFNATLLTISRLRDQPKSIVARSHHDDNKSVNILQKCH